MNKLLDYIKQLNAHVADVATHEKALKLRKTLIIIGAITLAVGVIGLITAFALFATAGLSAFGTSGFTPRIIVPFCLIPVCGLLSGLGGMILSAGLSILIGGEAAKIVSDATVNRCSCGEIIKEGDSFCPSCGKSVRKTCPSCGATVESDDKFCTSCGKKL